MEHRKLRRHTFMDADSDLESVSRNKLVRDRLRAELLEQRYLAREPLRIGEIAERMHVSATPVREALLQLVGEGLVEFVHHKGFIVKTRSIRSTVELYELCEAILLYRILSMSKRPNIKLKMQNNFFNETLRESQRVDELERFYLMVFQPDTDNEGLLMMQRILGSTRVVRREILESLNGSAPIFDLYRTANQCIAEGCFAESALSLQAAFHEKMKYVEKAMVSLVTRHLL